MTCAIVISCNKKHKLYLLSLKANADSPIKTKYKSYSRSLNTVIKYAKYVYFKNKVTDIGNNSKKLWKFLNSELHKNHDKSTITELSDGTNTFTSDHDIANNLNKYFVNMGKNNVQVSETDVSNMICNPKHKV
jgi:hypothetical protein